MDDTPLPTAPPGGEYLPAVRPPDALIPDTSAPALGRLVWDRQSLGRFLTSKWGFATFALLPFTLGLSFVVPLVAYLCFTPRRIWIENGRLFADKVLPVLGVSTAGLKLELVRQFLFLPLGRALNLHFTDDAGHPHTVGVNGLFGGKEVVQHLFSALLAQGANRLTRYIAGS